MRITVSWNGNKFDFVSETLAKYMQKRPCSQYYSLADASGDIVFSVTGKSSTAHWNFFSRLHKNMKKIAIACDIGIFSISMHDSSGAVMNPARANS